MRWWLVCLAMACGGRSSGPAPAPTKPPPAAAPAMQFSPNLPRALVDAVTGQPLYIEQFTSLALFGDERLAAQQIIADWATANGLTVIAPASVEAIVDKAQRGLDPGSGKACGPGLDRRLAVERWLPQSRGHIDAAVSCETECILQVQIQLDGRGTEFYAAAFDTGQPWREELARRLGTVVDNGGHGQYGHANNPVAVPGVARGTGDLVIDPARDLALPGAEAIAKACGLRGIGISFLLDGRRCEAFPGYFNETDPAIAECACKQVTAKLSPTGRRITRLETLSGAGSIDKTRNGKVLSAMLIGGNEFRTSGAAWFVPGQSDPSVSHCFIDRTEAVESTEVNATIDFDVDGRADKVTIADLRGLLTAGEHECLRKAMRDLRTPCPGGARVTGTARIAWRISDG